MCITVVKEGNSAIFEVKAVPFGLASQAEFVPEAADEGDPGALAQRFYVVAVLSPRLCDYDVLSQLCISCVASVLIWHDPWHICGCGGLDELGLLVSRCGDRHCNNEDLLALKRLNKGRLVVVIDFLDLHTRG